MTSSKGSGNALLGAGFLSAGAGSGIICRDEDKSFVCTIKRIVGTLQGLIFIGLLLFLIYYVFKNRKTIFK